MHGTKFRDMVVRGKTNKFRERFGRKLLHRVKSLGAFSLLLRLVDTIVRRIPLQKHRLEFKTAFFL